MHFKTVSIITSLLIASASAHPPSGPPSGPPKHLPPCKPGHYWPDPFDCHSFFECAAGGHPVRKTCGPGTAYCWEVGVCVHEEESKCKLPGSLQSHEFPGKGPEGHGPPPGMGPKGHGPPPGKGPQGHGPPPGKAPQGHGPPPGMGMEHGPQ